MCGIVGVIGDVTMTGKDVFRDMVDVCQVRGRDATGVIRVKQDKSYSWVKEVGPPSFLFDTRRWEVLERGLAGALIGHCRKKTVGMDERKNAHPFDFPDQGICGVHNGTLKKYHSFPEYSAGKIDSEVLFEMIANRGPEETFSEIEGAFATVWWDNNTGTVNFFRNKERPLYFMWSDDKRMMFFASEPWMFHVVERRIKAWEPEDGPKIYALPEDSLWSFEINPMNNDELKKIIFKQPKKIPPKEVELVTSYTNRFSGGTVWVKGQTDNKGGGHVQSPFGVQLNDNLDDIGRTQEEKPTMPISAVNFLSNSQEGTATKKDSPSSLKQERSTLSLPPPTSTASPPTNRKKSLGGSNGLVSLRVVAGVDYITDNETGVEYNVNEFEKNTDASCCHCNIPIGSLTEVYRFFDKTRFICTTCVEE